jgi:MFS family permease
MTHAISASGGLGRRRRMILSVIGLAQLMVVLDLTVMNIALPSAQRALHFTTVDRQWVVTAYTLAFGSLLLPGGRLADLLGRKATFLAGFAGRHLRPAAPSSPAPCSAAGHWISRARPLRPVTGRKPGQPTQPKGDPP